MYIKAYLYSKKPLEIPSYVPPFSQCYSLITRQAAQLICLGCTITQYYSTLLRYNYELYNIILQILSYYVTIRIIHYIT